MERFDEVGRGGARQEDWVDVAVGSKLIFMAIACDSLSNRDSKINSNRSNAALPAGTNLIESEKTGSCRHRSKSPTTGSNDTAGPSFGHSWSRSCLNTICQTKAHHQAEESFLVQSHTAARVGSHFQEGKLVLPQACPWLESQSPSACRQTLVCRFGK